MENVTLPIAFSIPLPAAARNSASCLSSRIERIRPRICGEDQTFLSTRPVFQWHQQDFEFRAVPLQVFCGRRSAKIATRKNAEDARRSKIYARMGKKIITAVKQGNSADPKANAALNAVINAARMLNVPKDNIEKVLKRASEPSQAAFISVMYEVVAQEGVGILVEAFTDNTNRANSEVRTAVTRAGAKMSTPGSVSFNFVQKGVIRLRDTDKSEDDIFMAATEAGAEDFFVDDDGSYVVYTERENLSSVKENLENGLGVVVGLDDANLEWVPNAKVDVSDDTRDTVDTLIETLEELDDVNFVYTNLS